MDVELNFSELIRYTHMEEESSEREQGSEEFNLLEEYHKELQLMTSELEMHSNLTEMYDHATVITLILITSLAIFWEKYYLSIALIPMAIYFFIKFLHHRKLKKLSQYHIYFLKALFRKNYGS